MGGSCPSGQERWGPKPRAMTTRHCENERPNVWDGLERIGGLPPKRAMKAQAKKLGCFATILFARVHSFHWLAHPEVADAVVSTRLDHSQVCTMATLEDQSVWTETLPWKAKWDQWGTNHLGFCTRVKRCCAPFQPLETLQLEVPTAVVEGFAGKCIKLPYCQKVHSVLFPKVQNEKLPHVVASWRCSVFQILSSRAMEASPPSVLLLWPIRSVALHPTILNWSSRFSDVAIGFSRTFSKKSNCSTFNGSSPFPVTVLMWPHRHLF